MNMPRTRLYLLVLESGTYWLVRDVNEQAAINTWNAEQEDPALDAVRADRQRIAWCRACGQCNADAV
jgi:hypothetical protein